jgi:hypothetical protein
MKTRDAMTGIVFLVTFNPFSLFLIALLTAGYYKGGWPLVQKILYGD